MLTGFGSSRIESISSAVSAVRPENVLCITVVLSIGIE